MQIAAKAGTGEIRHDLEPLTKRFPQLSHVISVDWMSGRMGGAEVPGPSVYWIDAILEIPEAEYAEFFKGSSESDNSLTEDFSEQLRGLVPEGPLFMSDDLNERFSQGSFVSKVYLAADGRTMILSAVFD